MKVELLAACAAIVLAAGRTAAQSQMPMDMPMDAPMSMMEAPLGLGEGREASGTSWLPDETVVYGPMKHAGPWMLMAHGRAFLQFIDAPVIGAIVSSAA